MKNKDKVKELRARTGLSQEAFGEYIGGASRRTIQSWELGTRDIPSYILYMLEFLIDSKFPISKTEE